MIFQIVSTFNGQSWKAIPIDFCRNVVGAWVAEEERGVLEQH